MLNNNYGMKKMKLALVAMSMFASVSTFAQTADEIINNHFNAIGGKDKIAALKSVRMECNLSMMGQELPMVITRAQGVGQRVDLSIMGTENYIIATPTAGWMFMPIQGQTEAQPMPEEMLKATKEQLDLQGPLFNYKEKGNTVELAGKEAVDGSEAYKLKVTDKGGKVAYWYIDAKTFYHVKSVMSTNVNGEDMEVSVTQSNFKKTADGYVFPWTIGNSAQGDMNVTKLDVNVPVDEKLFKPNK
jgi:hypothetical protein